MPAASANASTDVTGVSMARMVLRSTRSYSAPGTRAEDDAAAGLASDAEEVLTHEQRLREEPSCSGAAALIETTA